MAEQGLEELIAKLNSSDVVSRQEAAECLMSLGPDGQLATIALCKAAGDSDEVVRESSVAALEELGPPDIGDCQRLADLLPTDNSEVAYWAATLLGRLGDAAAGQTALIAQAVADHPSATVRQRCAWALGKIGPAARAAISVLESALESDDARLVRLATAALDEIRGD
ncbi:MAG: HEAT repeat domain-containing protein [Pirellulales bacterium]|nr:HEAT repeat domain-containing protein [Pirellulales bacterium]